MGHAIGDAIADGIADVIADVLRTTRKGHPHRRLAR